MDKPIVMDIGIEGMSCASCVARVERALRQAPGVTGASVNLATESVRMTLSAPTADGAPPPEVLRAIRNAGYAPRASALPAGNAQPRSLGLPRDLWPIVAGLLLCAPLVAPMLLAPWLGAHRAHLLVPVWAQFVLSTLVQFTLGLRFYRAAWHALRQRSGNMELLVAIGSTAAWALSLWLWMRQGAAAPVYFESGAVIVTLVALGKWIEARARRGAAQAIAALHTLRPDVAHWISPFDGEQDVPLAEVMAGDVLRVRPGERVPADGTVIAGHSAIDVSMLTGEPLPVEVAPGSAVTGGTLNGNGVLDVRVTAPATQGVLAHIMQLVSDAQTSKPPLQRLADRVAAVFVPAVLLLALAVLAGWLWAGLPVDAAVLRAVSVLVIACPCALGLATPVAVMAGTGVAAQQGIVVRDGAALERACRISAVVLDKTGTVTQGMPRLLDVAAADSPDTARALSVALALQQGSEHPLAQAVRDAWTDEALPAAAQQVQAVPGCGLTGLVEGAHWLLGSLRWVQQQGAAPHDDAPVHTQQPSSPQHLADWLQHWQQQGATVSALAQRMADGSVRIHAWLAFGDTLKAEAAQAVAQLRARGLRVLLLSGDGPQAVRHVAAQLGLGADDAIAQALPADKAQAVRALQASGSVAMVGDGINDAPALAAADLGLAMAGGRNGADVALHSADISLLRGDLRLVAASLDISQRTVRTIRQNLFWAFAYNVLALPLAAAGWLNPMMAGAAMAASSVSVVANALRLRRWRGEGQNPAPTKALQMHSA